MANANTDKVAQVEQVDIAHDLAVDIAISLAHTTAVLYIEDNGPGISDEDMPRVSEPFYRSSSST